MSRTVNVDLYEFLKSHETGLYKEDFLVTAYVHVDFYDLDKFVEIVGEDWFAEGGIQVQMFARTICVELNDIIEGEGNCLSDYKNCFNKHDWNEYSDAIEFMEME